MLRRANGRLMAVIFLRRLAVVRIRSAAMAVTGIRVLILLLIMARLYMRAQQAMCSSPAGMAAMANMSA